MSRLGRIFKRDAALRARLGGILVHDLRRAAEPNPVRAGVRERVAMAPLGLQTMSMFNRYRIVADADLARAR